MIPFNGLNHCCGITGVSLHDFTVSLVGVLPYQIYTIMLGATAATLGQQNTTSADNDQDIRTRAQLVAFIVVMTAGTLFGLIAMVYAWRAIKHELKKELHLSSEEFEHLVHPPIINDDNNNNNTGGCCGGGGNTTEVVPGNSEGDPTCSYVGGLATTDDGSSGPVKKTTGVDGIMIINPLNGGNREEQEQQQQQQTLEDGTYAGFEFNPQQQQQQQDYHQSEGISSSSSSDNYGIEAVIYRDDDEKWYWVWA